LSCENISLADVRATISWYHTVCGETFSQRTRQYFPSYVNNIWNEFSWKDPNHSLRFTWTDAIREAERSDISSLKEFSSNQIENIVKKYYVEQPNKKALLISAIGVMWIIQQSTSGGFFELNFHMVLGRISYRDHVMSSYVLIAVLMDALETRALFPFCKTGAQSFARFDTPMKLVVSLLCSFISQFRFITLESCLFVLSEMIDSEIAVQLIQELLSSTELNLREKIAFLEQRRFTSPSWEDPDFFKRQVEYHETFMEVSARLAMNPTGSNDEGILPVYYGNVPANIIPVLDHLVFKLVESGQDKLLEFVAQMFGTLYLGSHHAPISFVYSLLTYFHSSLISKPRVRLCLMHLCCKFEQYSLYVLTIGCRFS
jgi:hypothetical protein